MQKLRPKGYGNQLNFTRGRTETNILHSAGGCGGGVGSAGGRERGVVGRNTEGGDDEPGNTWSISSISSVSKFSKNIQQTIERKFK